MPIIRDDILRFIIEAKAEGKDVSVLEEALNSKEFPKCRSHMPKNVRQSPNIILCPIDPSDFE